MATVPLDAIGHLRSERPGPETLVEQHKRDELVLQAIGSLPQGQRIATTLFYIDGYSQKEVAAFLDVPVSTVNNRLYAARKRLKERMMNMLETTLKQYTLPEDFAQPVFFRRYNGPDWQEPGAPGSFEALEGNLEVEYEGIHFRHWYDCIPDHALESALW